MRLYHVPCPNNLKLGGSLKSFIKFIYLDEFYLIFFHLLVQPRSSPAGTNNSNDGRATNQSSNQPLWFQRRVPTPVNEPEDVENYNPIQNNVVVVPEGS